MYLSHVKPARTHNAPAPSPPSDTPNRTKYKTQLLTTKTGILCRLSNRLASTEAFHSFLRRDFRSTFYWRRFSLFIRIQTAKPALPVHNDPHAHPEQIDKNTAVLLLFKAPPEVHFFSFGVPRASQEEAWPGTRGHLPGRAVVAQPRAPMAWRT